MKRIIQSVITGVFCLAILLGIPARSLAKIDPDKIDLNMDISKLGVEDLRLYRNAVYARHCYLFWDGILRGSFSAYQDKKCSGELYSWDFSPYRNKSFDESSLSPAEAKFVARVKKREDKIKAGQIKLHDQGPVYDRQAIVNFSQFATLPGPVLDRLLQTGFAVTPARHEQLFHVYEENDYHHFPSFITADSVLQLYHLYFDFSLRQIEQEHLLPAANRLCRGMVEKLRARRKATSDEPLREALRRAILYFAVGQDLSTISTDENEEEEGQESYSENMEFTPPALVSAADLTWLAPAWMPEPWKKDFLAQRELILKAQKLQKGPIMGTVDYTMFEPRGHYTRSLALARYFRTLMWLGLPGFILDEEVMPIETPLVVVYELVHDPKLLEQYNLIYEPTSFYVGPTDDITPELVKKVVDEICGPNALLEQWIAKKEAIREELIKRNPVRIKTEYADDQGRSDDRNKPQVRFMGMRYIPDSEILQRLTNWPLRAFPTGLDIFGVMGVPAALEILRQAKTDWPGYWPEMEKLQAEFKDLKPPAGEINLYWRWLRLLKTLNQPAPQGAAPFMRFKPWEYRNLNTSLASWTELRHDTILYSKPSAAECGDGEYPPWWMGYVEARPDFFKELLELQRDTTLQLKKQGLLDPRLQKVGGHITSSLTSLQKISQKEIEGQPLTFDEYERIRLFGGELEQMTMEILTDDRFVRFWSQVSGPDQFIAVVADVHAGKDPAQQKEMALEEAVGYGDELYALVEIQGYLYLTRGAVFSYYEFKQPVSNRLSDEEWQKMLRAGKAPTRPEWHQEFMLDQPAKELPMKYPFGCPVHLP